MEVVENEVKTEEIQEHVETTQDSGKLPKSQDELDRMISARLKRDRTKWEGEFTQKLEDERQKAKMDENERLKAEKDEVEKTSSTRVAKARGSLLKAHAQLIANGMGVKADRTDAVFTLAKDALGDIEFNNDDEPDVAAIKKVVEKVLVKFPEFVGTVEKSAAGTDFSGSDKPALDVNNMTPEQYRANRKAMGLKQF